MKPFGIGNDRDEASSNNGKKRKLEDVEGEGKRPRLEQQQDEEEPMEEEVGGNDEDDWAPQPVTPQPPDLHDFNLMTEANVD